MKTVCEFNKCTGCMACIDTCQKEAIEVKDSLSAYNALIDENKCIACNACNKVCQLNNEPKYLKPMQWKEGWAVDESIRRNSSSGGLGTAIELSFIKNGGIVYSCSFQNGLFCFDIAENETDLRKFRGSKYVKSNPIGVYKKIKAQLKSGKKVLFLGLPCQVSAVNNYIRDKENLYTVDLICHGTPSPRLLELFLVEQGISLHEIDEISFRTKTNFCLGRNGKPFSVAGIKDSYIMSFLKSTIYTDNCYECQYAKLERISDITLGDSWGSDKSNDEKKRGISLLLMQTEKGKQLVEQSNLQLYDVNLERAIQANSQLDYPSVKPLQRDIFFKEVNKGFERAVRKCYPKEFIKNKIKTLFYKLKKHEKH